jgi:hypothetical protein
MFRQTSLPLYDTPATIRRAIIAIGILLVLGFLGWRVHDVFAPPSLIVASPSDRLATSSRIITISGSTEPGAVLSVNGEEFAPDAGGFFKMDVVLRPGTNTLAIEARQRHGRPNRIERTIHVQRNEAPLA